MKKSFTPKELQKLPIEIQKYHIEAARIASQEVQQIHLANEIVKKYCPYKVGQKVHYRRLIQGDNVKDSSIKYGIIKTITFKGYSNTGTIDGKWIIRVQASDYDFKVFPIGVQGLDIAAEIDTNI